MHKQVLLKRLMKEEFSRSNFLYNKLAKEFKELPRGSLTEREEQLYRYVRENGKQYLIPIYDDDQLIDELKQRQYLKKALPVLKKHVEACLLYLEKDKLFNPSAIEKLLPPRYQNADKSSNLLKGDIDINRWKNEIHQTNTMAFQEEHYTAGGVKCRSKSEALIGTRLEERGIPYKYEVKLVLPWRTVYADFQILLQITRRLVYLEHFGKMDDMGYMTDSIDRIQAYSAGGFYLGYDFFFTTETRKKPLNMKAIDKKIDEIMAWNVIR